MKEITIYLLETMACSGILLACYAVLLEKRVPFRWCRLYLLAATALAGIIPLLRIPVWPGEVIALVPAVQTDAWTAEIAADPAPVPSSPLLTPALACALLHAAGAVLIVGTMCWQIVQIRRLRRGAAILRTERYTLVRTPQKIASFSFFRSIYVWDETPAAELEAIVLHEASHIAHRHSAERIAMELLKAAMWWNPFAWIAARRLTETEEFEADSDVLKSGYDLPAYMNTLFKQLFGHRPDIANGLRDSLTKKRFQMMTKRTRSRHALLRLAGTVPAAIGLLCAFGFTTRAAEYRMPASAESILLPAPPPAPAEQVAQAEQPAQTASPAPEKAGRKADFRIRVAAENAEDSTVQIAVAGALITIVGSDRGVATDRSGHATMFVPEGAVVEVTQMGCKPLVIRTDGSSEYSAVLEPAPVRETLSGNSGEGGDGPLYVIDGKPLAPRERYDFDTARIASITVLSGKSAADLYGERGRNGAVLIATKEKGAEDENGEQAFFEERMPEPQAVAKMTADEELPFLNAEIMPQFQGGDFAKFRAWAQSQIRYPDIALKNKISGRVVAEFVVEKDGSVKNIRILQTPDRSLSEEAVRILSSSPAWKPGLQRGKVIRVKYTIPINFAIDKKAAGSEPLAKTAGEELPFLMAETMPQFQGGDLAKFRTWAHSQIRYPAVALKNKISGCVVAEFVVEKDGSVQNIQIVQTPDRSLSEETVRILSSSPAWKPGLQRGKVVRVKFMVPIDFKIDKKVKAQAAAAENEPVVRAEQMPEFEGGGIQAFRTWVQSRVRYPEKALKSRVAGRVIVQFIIEKDGSVSGIETLRSPDKLLDEEVRRVVASSSGKWKPGRNDGKKVRVRHILPVDFSIASGKDTVRGEEKEPDVAGSVEKIVVTAFDNRHEAPTSARPAAKE